MCLTNLTFFRDIFKLLKNYSNDNNRVISDFIMLQKEFNKSSGI